MCRQSQSDDSETTCGLLLLVKWRTSNADSRLPMQSVKSDIRDEIKQTLRNI